MPNGLKARNMTTQSNAPGLDPQPFLKPKQDRLARLARIGKASFLFQLAISFSFLLGVYWLLAFLFGWPFFGQDKARIVRN